MILHVTRSLKKIFLEENENKLVNTAIYKRSTESLRSKDISSLSHVFYKKAVPINLTKFTEFLSRSLAFDKFIGLQP